MASSTRLLIPPCATKKIPPRSTLLAATAIPVRAACTRLPHAATACPWPLTPPSLALAPILCRTAPPRAHSASAWPSLRLRPTIHTASTRPTLHPRGLPLRLRLALHSASVCPTLPPHGHPSRPSTATRPIRGQLSRPRRAASTTTVPSGEGHRRPGLHLPRRLKTPR